MATNSIRKSGPRPGATDNGASGFTVSPGPYEAIVQGHVKGSRMGQLIVTITDWGAGVTPYNSIATGDGGSENSDQITVSYASPFYGVTYNSLTGDAPNTPQTSGQSYGMWFVPPDIGNTVLVTFIGGDTSRGYWFGCVYNSPSHHMVPGNARNIGPNTVAPPDSDGLNSKINKTNIQNLPVVEYDINDPNAFTDGFKTTPRYPHEYQSAILINQGLDQDKIRGAISSSSLRESPSNVYGISTPGRALGNKSQDASQDQAVYFRNGGHSFVMDDGADGTGKDPEGTDQLIRLRTAGGHQILMNDTENVFYVASASGAQWLEFSADGSINVFGAAGINMRSTGPMNFHSDASITLDSPHVAINAMPSTKLPSSALGALGIIPSISIKSMGKMSLGSALATDLSSALALSVAAPLVNVSAGGTLNLGGQASTILTSTAVVISGSASTQISGGLIGLNCNPPLAVPKAPTTFVPPIPHTLPDTLLSGSNWVNGGDTLLTTVSVAPAHEPWLDKDGKSRPKPVGGLIGLAAGALLGGVTSSLTQTTASTISSATAAVTNSLPSVSKAP